MKATVFLDCDGCDKDIPFAVTTTGKQDIPFRLLREAASQKGWHLGRNCYCPDCLAKLPAHCQTCDHFEGSKNCGAMICRLDGGFTLAQDYCEKHYDPWADQIPVGTVQGSYKNPIPTLDG